jgi:hypothetical protein
MDDTAPTFHMRQIFNISVLSLLTFNGFAIHFYDFGITMVLQICVKKVKVTLVQALRLCTGRTAHRGSRGIALPFHDHSTRRE